MIRSGPDLRRVPTTSRLLVVANGDARARLVRKLSGAADWRRELADRVATASLSFGTGRADDAVWLWPAIKPAALIEQLSSFLGDIQLLGAVRPRQRGRERLSLLADRGGEMIVIKLGRPNAGLEREATALDALQRNPLPCIATPRVLGSGRLASEASHSDGPSPGPVSFIATSALALDRQHPALNEPLRTFERDLNASMASIERPLHVPGHNVVVHGDLTPWNLRRTARGLALFDWEALSWGPPGSDVECYRRASAQLPRSPLNRSGRS